MRMDMGQYQDTSLASTLRQLWAKDTEPTEVIAAGFALYWAVVLALPGPTFATSPSYAVMARRAPEGVWCVFFALIVLLPLVSWIFDNLWLRLCGLAGHVLIWPGVAVMVLTANPNGTGGVYGVLALGVSWVFCRICGEHATELTAVATGLWRRVRRA